ncbi:MAG TPA: LPXTG cell wall anchor domain-containing protein [Sediminibacterium sp.]|nr:LPXTG cell wall anchor domain-containing protein [Sediminibacterium sp.]
MNQLLPIREKPLCAHPQTLIYHQNRLYALVAGSGVVYESEPINPLNDSLYFKRLDTTSLIGYNIDCFNFFYKDSLYNLGGYGFWRWNGQLRKFNPAVREWDIEPLNIELPLFNESMHANIWYQQKAHKIWALSSLEGNQALKTFHVNKERQIDSVMVLNLETMNWELKGILNPELANNLYNVNLICSNDSGLLVNRNGSIEYWNLLTNQVGVLGPTYYRQLLTAKLDFRYVWCNNHTLFISKTDPLLPPDSIRLSPGDFIAAGISIYVPATGAAGDNLYYQIAGLVVLIGGMAVVVSRKTLLKKRPKVQPHLHHATSVVKPAGGELRSAYSKEDLFTAIESALIKLILLNTTTHQKLTSIDEMNRTLGIAHKSTDMQKRKRSDTINSINEKYMIATGNKEAELIKRVKSELDGRMHEFFIPQEEVAVIKKILSGS